MAFTGYFATFAVFFFIPLYLQLIGTASPYDVALDFLPMAAAMIVASALSGRWVARVGPGLPMAAGCVVRRRRDPGHQRPAHRQLRASVCSVGRWSWSAPASVSSWWR